MAEIKNTFIKFNPEYDWMNDSSHYSNICSNCNKSFWGAKQRSQCKSCHNKKVASLGKPCLFQNKADLLSQMGISDDQYNNDTVTHAVVHMLLNGDKPLQVLGYMVENFARYQKEMKEIIEKFPSHTTTKTDDNNLHS